MLFPALIKVYNSEDKKYFMNRYLVAIGGFCIFLCILGFMVLGLANIEFKEQLKAKPVNYEIVIDSLYRKVP